MQSYGSLKSGKNLNLLAEKNGYCLIKPWLEQMANDNIGNVFDYREKVIEGELLPKIEFCFFMPDASMNLFRHSLPIITLDACHTKGNYKGMIFTATATTGDNKGSVISYGIGPTECYEYWKLFLQKLKVGLNLSQINNLVIISDREKGLIQAVREELPAASHSYCVFHIEKILGLGSLQIPMACCGKLLQLKNLIYV